jgi:hypothetical protein
MALTVACPGCSRTVNVPDHLIGELVKCPVCSKQFKVEPEVHPPEPVLPVDTPTMPYTAKPERPSAARRDEDEDSNWQFSPNRRRDLEPHRGTLILVLGILSIVLPCAALIVGPVGWFLGSSDLRAMHDGRMDSQGEGTTRAGYICSIIGTAIHLVGLLSCCGLQGMRFHL